MIYPETQLENNRRAQRIASETLDELAGLLHPGMNEDEIATLTCELMEKKGSGPFWYHGVGALVLLGKRSVLSLSARNYVPDMNNCLEAKELVDEYEGLEAELELHRILKEELSPDMTYEEVYQILTEEIHELGFVNLDFHGNLGHSIETDEKKRICLEMGNNKSFREYGKPFTLEPHICLRDGKYGYKRENIYYISDDRFVEL